MRKKLLLLLAVGMAVLVGAEIPGASRETGRDPGAMRKVRTAVEEVGASISHPKGWEVERERFTLDGTRGYTLWRPEPSRGDAHEHGGSPAVRVALAYDLEPRQIGERVEDKLSEAPELPLRRQTVRVGQEGVEGTAVGPIPGSTPHWEVYAAVEGRVYQVNVYGETLDAEDRSLLSSIRFDPPSESASSSSLGLPDGEDAATFYPERRVAKPSAAEKEARREAAATSAPDAEPSRSASATRAASATGERRISGGCWRADGRFFVQTQHGYGANRSASDGIPTGYTVVGRPNFWGQYTHGNLGYGRCVSTYYTNDYYAVDYPFNRGDYVFSPFRSGRVTFAGRNSSHANYGVFVVIRSGKYVSMSAHLSRLAPGIRRGAVVNADTVIGYAGNTGDPSIPVGEVHLHQAFYRYPGYLADGSPYGGQGLQVLRHHYVGNAARTGPGVYQFGWSRSSGQISKGSRISN